MTAPPPSAAAYVETLMRRRCPAGASPPASSRRLSPWRVAAGVAQKLLDRLILSTSEDEGLARLVAAALALGGEALAAFQAHMDALLGSGRTVRVAYGLTLAGLLACRSDRLRQALHATGIRAICGASRRMPRRLRATMTPRASGRRWTPIDIRDRAT
jgi:hypothetical protein